MAQQTIVCWAYFIGQIMNNYSCVLNSFAYAINYHSDELAKIVGHDGSAIVAPELPEPFCRRGYCLEELFEALLSLGYACIHIPKHRYVNNMAMVEPIVLDHQDHVAKYLNIENQYVLYSDRHCVGVRNGLVYDPQCKVTSIFDFKYAGIIVIRIL